MTSRRTRSRSVFRLPGGATQRADSFIEQAPRRPGRRSHAIGDYFMMDFENECLSQNWDSSKRPHPKGPKRHEDPEWAAMIQSQVYPHHSDVDWEEYVEWSSVHGDEWFLEWFPENEEEEEKAWFCKKHEAGPLDVWYDCDACVQEVQGGPKPCGRRYLWLPLSSINGQRSTPTDI